MSEKKRKKKLRNQIHDIIANEIDEDPDLAAVVAIVAIWKLMLRMGEGELREWLDSLRSRRLT